MYVGRSSEGTERRHTDEYVVRSQVSWVPQSAIATPKISSLGGALGLVECSSPLILLLKRVIDPIAVVLALYIPAIVVGRWQSSIFYAGVVAALIAGVVFDGRSLLALRKNLLRQMASLISRWLLLLIIMWVIGTIGGYDIAPEVLTIWVVLAPILLLAIHAVIHWWLLQRRRMSLGGRSSVVIVGATRAGHTLARMMRQESMLQMQPVGFFDDRLPQQGRLGVRVLGGVSDVATYVREQRVGAVYITLPMTSQPRILDLIDQLKDTTASVYFVPDMFVFDLIQARLDHVEGVPVISICDSPFYGFSGVVKRCFDVVFSSLGLVAFMPLMLLVAISVKVTSSGPVIFSQRRYGLNGETINVYKFRTMNVLENGSVIRQVTRDDGRLTPIGAFLRRTSLDELPQLLNVLNGSMSLIGPRPHATAHNEMYRHLIKGYMIRHKVRPGITGWAQVNGFRGPTETLGLMEKRVQLDLDYLRYWSLWLDIKIIVKTLLLFWRDKSAL